MIRKSITGAVLFFTLIFTDASAQDPQFSQFYANPLYLNPALAGASVCPRLIGNFRDQWPALGNAFITYSASYDQYVNFLHGGIGVSFMADRTGGGNLNATSINFTYAFKFNITSRLYAATALQAGYYQRTVDWYDLIFEDMIDPNTGTIADVTIDKVPDRTTVGVPDFSAGVMIGYDEKFYGGVAVSHLTQPKVGFYAENNTPLYMKFTVHAGALFDLGSGGSFGDEEREFSISPNILYQQQFLYHQLNLGLCVTFDPIVAGLWFRHNFENADAIIPFVGFHYMNLRIGFSYDWTISNLKGASGGAYEASASWQFPCIEKRRVIKAIKCPRF